MKHAKGNYFRIAIDVLLVMVAVGCLVALFTANPDQSEMGAVSVEPALRHVVVLARHGERYPIIPVSPFEYELGVQTVAGQEQVHHLGERLRKQYKDFLLSVSEVIWIATDDARNIEASETVLAELRLNATSFRILPPVLNSGLDEFYMRVTPVLDYLRSGIPECIRSLAELEMAEAPEDVITFWSYLMVEALDTLSTSTPDIAAALNVSDDCIPVDRPLVSPEMFLNVTVSCTPLFMPVINSLLIEVISTANDRVDVADLTSQHRLKVMEDKGPSLSVYGVSDFHIELVLMCLRANGIVMDRPNGGAHVIFELGNEDMVKVIYRPQWDVDATFVSTLSLASFTKRIMLCDYIARGTSMAG